MNELLENLEWFKKIEVLRAIKGWTQREASERCFTNQKAYWSWESGLTFPTKNSRRAISKAFGVIESDIFDDIINSRYRRKN